MAVAIALLSASSGALVHQLIFRHGEWDVASPRIVLTYMLLVAMLTMIPFHDESFKEVAAYVGCHIAGIYGSMLIYRAFFHRLDKFPGPIWARLTNFYISFLSARRLQLFKEVEKLHEKYGDYVRLGPSELSIVSPEAVKLIYGSQSKCSKGPFYTLLEPRTALVNVRDKAEHARRRKVWDQGFSTKALQGYDYRISNTVEELLQVIKTSEGRPINMTNFFTYFAFDVMEDLTFNQSSNMVRDGKTAYVLEAIRKSMYGFAVTSHLSWLLPLMKRTPIINRDYLRFLEYIQQKIDQRRMDEPARPDIFSWVLDDYSKSKKTRTDKLNLHGDAHQIIVAGSDTTATTLSHMFCELAYRPELVAKLQHELEALPDLNHSRLCDAPLLDAVINETLRLHPALPSGMQRVTPKEGLQIGKVFVPGNTIVQMPSHTLFRDPRAFELPTQFIPERWTTQPELVIDRSVFIPFGTGPYGCVGKRLAMMELRRVLAETMSRYDVSFAPGQTREAFLEGKLDSFTSVPAPLHLVFNSRVLGSITA